MSKDGPAQLFGLVPREAGEMVQELQCPCHEARLITLYSLFYYVCVSQIVILKQWKDN